MHTGRRNQPREPVEQLEGAEADRGPSVVCGAGQLVGQAGFGGAQWDLRRRGAKPVQREGGPRTVPEQSLESSAVMGGDPH